MIYGRWLGADVTGACLAVVAPRDTPEGYAGTLVGLFTELCREVLFSECTANGGESITGQPVEGRAATVLQPEQDTPGQSKNTTS